MTRLRIAVAAFVPAVVCGTLLDSHFDGPTVVVLAGIALVYLALVAWRLLDHTRFVRSLRRLAVEGEFGGVPVRYVNGLAPFVAGIVRPHMYCDPDLARRLTVSQQRAVVLHELHHVQRRDPLRLQLTTALRPLAGPLPGLRARLDAHAARYEIAADRFALRHGATRADVAGALLAMLGDDGLHLAPGFVSAAETRLRALTGDTPAGSESSTSLAALLVVAACAVIACLIVL
jgi:beta-lactamase regulating signal transducer with metallopeptidase domain